MEKSSFTIKKQGNQQFPQQKALCKTKPFSTKMQFLGEVKVKTAENLLSTGDVEKLSTFCQQLFTHFHCDIPPRHASPKALRQGTFRAFPYFPQSLIRLRLDLSYHSFLFSPARPFGPLGAERQIKGIVDFAENSAAQSGSRTFRKF
ncbi:MAG: hypothetical protein IKM08_09920 [Clostridia bacterium]|nr:hypothetical protein [Clostridia bacterium]